MPSRMNGWNPAKMPFTFTINRGTSGLAGAVILERHDGKRLVVMLFSRADFGLAFDVAKFTEIRTFE
jgi:hypothetical protein